MKQFFPEKKHEEIKKYFSINTTPGEWDNFYIEKTIKYIRYIKWIPGLKMIGIGNSISMNCSKESSDIDLYIVTEKNRLWLVRILTTLIFQILGVRKNKKNHSGRFCLSFFSTLKGMDFGSFALKDDIYLYFWIIYFKPILDFDNTYKSFLDKNKSWADFLEYSDILEKNKESIKYKSECSGKYSKFLDFIENILKKIFLPKTKKSFAKLEKPFGVIINNDLLKFHDKDIRENIKEVI